LLRFISLLIVLLALTTGIVSGLSAPVAEFIVNKTYGPAPFGQLFVDLSTGEQITSWAWDFENDGIIDSTQEFPWYTYQDPGNYTVSLTVTNAAGSDTETKPDYIIVLSAIAFPHPDFSATPTSGPQPLAVQFTDLSTGDPITSWAWDFQNDGIVDSTQQNPTFTYTSPGTYTVKLTVTNTAGSDSEVKPGYIIVTPPAPPVAQFTGVPTSGKRPLTVRFTDQSTGAGITSWAWDFQNDGIIDSTGQNPAFTYTKAGTYSVKLTVTNPGGSTSKTKWSYITVKR
jgi:PKD repeat protein